MRDRLIFERIQRSSKSLLLLGPRQVGKSTLCRALHPSRTINLADEENYVAHAKDAGLLRRELAALARPALVFIDEVQRLPSLLNTVQSLMDEGRGLRFLLTGSSARKLKRGGANLLPGRLVMEYLDPLTYWELGADFDLEKCLQRGALPGIYDDPDGGFDTLETYAQVYLREEIQVEALVKNVGAYARFLDAAAGASGQWINYSKLASDAEIPKDSLRRFYGILEETLLTFRVPHADTKTSRRVTQRDRFVFFDLGVRNALLGVHRSKQSAQEMGQLFEQWILLQCLFYARAHRKPWRVSSYRTDAGAEVDVVVETEDRRLAIECKWGRIATSGLFRGLRSFADVSPKPVLKCLVYQGDHVQKFGDGEYAVPYRTFLSEWLPKGGSYV